MKLESSKSSKKSLDSLFNGLKMTGLLYSAFFGSTTVGAIGGLAYSLITGDVNIGKNIGYGALCGAGLEPLIFLGLAIEGSFDCEW